MDGFEIGLNIKRTDLDDDLDIEGERVAGVKDESKISGSQTGIGTLEIYMS